MECAVEFLDVFLDFRGFTVADTIAEHRTPGVREDILAEPREGPDNV